MDINVAFVGAGGMGKLMVGAISNTPGFGTRTMVAPSLDDRLDFWFKTVEDCLATHPEIDVVVDFSTSEAANENVPKYIELGKPFVIGTTGWDTYLATNDKVSSVVAPNMSPRLVAIQAMLEFGARTFPKVFDGFSCRIDESHQKAKTGHSGTGHAWGNLFGDMGAEIAPMRAYRGKEEPHAYHEYDLVKGAIGRDATQIQLVTNIDGRNEYIDGTLAAINFLVDYVRGNGEPRVFSMIDVLSD